MLQQQGQAIMLTLKAEMGYKSFEETKSGVILIITDGKYAEMLDDLQNSAVVEINERIYDLIKVR